VNVKDVEDALVGIQSGGSSLEKAYDKTMKMIESQDRGFRKLAMHTFAWVAFSSAPLKGEELQHALAIELGKDSLDFNNITKLDIIISTCAGLIRLQNQWFGTTVHLVHETTQDYFDKTFVNVRPRLARLSLTYLTFQTFGSGPCESDEEQALKQQQYPLYYYLGLYLLGYIHDNAEDSKVKTMLKKFLLEDANVAAHMQTIPKSYVSSFGSPALNLAIFYRCGSLIPLLVHLRRKEHIHWGHTARFASQTKYFEGIKYLLSASEIDCNATSILKRTNLSEACRMGDENFVRLLLACDGIDCNLVDTYGRSPLTYALAGGHEAIVQLLLERVDVDYTSPSGFDIDPLSYAFHGESEGCVKELLKKPDVDANRILYWALWRWGGRISTFKELLRRPDFNVNWVDSQGWTLLILCIECRSLQPALLLLSHEDVNLNRPEETEPGPLIRAAKWGQPVLMEALLAKMGPYIFAKDSSRRTALDHAAESRNWQTVIRLLEEYETKISIECCFEHSALFHALKRAPPEVVEILFGQMNLNDSWWFVPALAISMESNTLECFLILEIKLQSWMQCHPEWMNVCLLRAAGKGTDGTLASILRCLRYYADGIDVEKVQFPHRVYWDNISMLEIVFDIPSAQLNIRDGQGQTALHAMARRQDFPATRILLVLGADTDARDDEGRTAFECASHWPDDLGWLKRNMLPSWHVALPRDWSWHISP
jgi:ankyrin repeat protein